jgi:hypothetical protein
LEDFIKEIKQRYASLSDEEKDSVRSLAGTMEGRVIAKVLGTRIMSQINFRKPTKSVKKRGLATR